jgi:hypothetical protein
MSFDPITARATIAAFRRKKKFSNAEWQKRGLLPSAAELSSTLESFFNDLAKSLLADIEAPSPLTAAERTLTAAIEALDRDLYDTEEAEFICTLLEALAQVFGLKFGPALNVWLYGEGLGQAATELAEREANVQPLRTLVQACSGCNSDLLSDITSERDDNEAEAWFSIECLTCGALNFLTLPPGIGSMRPTGYRFVQPYGRHQQAKRFSQDEEVSLNVLKGASGLTLLQPTKQPAAG